jgi:hypothetical protein
MGQKQAAYNEAGAIVAFYDTVDSPAPKNATVIDITDAEWLVAISSAKPYTVVNKSLVAPVDPTAAELLADAQSSKIAEIYAAYQEAVQVPVAYKTVAGVSQTFQADSGSQDTLLKATTGYNLTGSAPTGFYWVALDNTQVPFSLDDLKGLYGAMLSQGNVAFNKLQVLKASVRAAGTVADVEAVAW